MNPRARRFSGVDRAKPASSPPTALRVASFWGDTRLDAAVLRERREVVLCATPGDDPHELWGPLELAAERFSLVTHSGARTFVVVPEGAELVLERAGQPSNSSPPLAPCDLPHAAGVHPLLEGERAVVRHHTMAFVVEEVPATEDRLAASPRDWTFPRTLLASLLLHGFFVLAALVTPRLSEPFLDDALRAHSPHTQLILRPAVAEKPRPKLDLSGAKGSAAKGPEGKIGRRDRPPRDAMASQAGAPRVDPNKRERDRALVMKAGILGFLGDQGRPSAALSVLGRAEIGAGLNEAMGGLRGAEASDAGGVGGLGARGPGPGGGGPLGIGGLGRGPGRGAGGPGNIDLGGPGKSRTRLSPGTTIVKGSLSKDEIGRVIRAHLSRFKYCYERELNAHVGLGGKVSVHFTIAPTGSVADAKIRETSLGHAGVEGCVLQVMQSLRFPAPRGGGVVVVTYPFIFQQT